MLIQQRLHAEQGKQAFAQRGIGFVGRRQAIAHQGRGVGILRVPALLVVIAAVGLSVGVAKGDVADVVTCKR